MAFIAFCLFTFFAPVHHLKPWERVLVSGAMWRCLPFLYRQAEQTHLVGSTHQQAGPFQ